MYLYIYIYIHLIAHIITIALTIFFPLEIEHNDARELIGVGAELHRLLYCVGDTEELKPLHPFSAILH